MTEFQWKKLGTIYCYDVYLDCTERKNENEVGLSIWIVQKERMKMKLAFSLGRGKGGGAKKGGEESVCVGDGGNKNLSFVSFY